MADMPVSTYDHTLFVLNKYADKIPCKPVYKVVNGSLQVFLLRQTPLYHVPRNQIIVVYHFTLFMSIMNTKIFLCVKIKNV